MEFTWSDEHSPTMVLLFWVGLLICAGFMGLNVLFDIIDLSWIL